ncbi:unnamed protein product [Didymodactylos carnosus]|uniref:Uncharacterized protein n=1 Tax=Didymodactylos carnosus TaxID=1234261 RepID=A0A813NSL3_9BILA|nr:unnamed protein product [Didymodactylos carnosus]CAF0770696.1 unnamed protein product [Didymodactylos carnosus]CAF3519094.1 unnamed protein product [Didymodactylos carnosus]CAF3551541.1 unnamed protein product [Didymodactylos carnosus]
MGGTVSAREFRALKRHVPKSRRGNVVSGLNPKRPMNLRLLLTEPETGFILWSDTIDNKLTLPKEQIFSFRHSTQKGYVMVKFDQGQDYYDFYKFYTQITRNQNYKSLFLPSNTDDIKPKKSLQNIKKRFIKKSNISPPCDFKHLNHLQSNKKPKSLITGNY